MCQLFAFGLVDASALADIHARSSVDKHAEIAFSPCRTSNSLVAIVAKFPGKYAIPNSQIKILIRHSHLMDFLGDVYCKVVTRKQLPGCEHAVNIMCSKDPAEHSCQANCAGIMLCCGRTCSARCHQCQVVNPPGEGDVVQAAQRMNHLEHSCQKTLYCEHRCQNMCSQDHKCTTNCQEACRQVCNHARCNRTCSVACAPCQEPCEW